jgi:hypothetical protein
MDDKVKTTQKQAGRLSIDTIKRKGFPLQKAL